METKAKVTFDVGTARKGEKADAMSWACLEVGVEGGRCEEGAREHRGDTAEGACTREKF